MTHLMLSAGMIEMRSAVGIRQKSPWGAVFMLGFASVTEREADLKHAAGYWDRAHKFRDMGDGPNLRRWAGLLLDTAGGGSTVSRSAAHDYVESLKFRSPHQSFDMRPIIAAQVFRRVGATEEARRNMRKAERMLAGVPDWFCIPSGWQARHHRNLLELGTPAQQRVAREFFLRQVENGYRCFAWLLQEAQ